MIRRAAWAQGALGGSIGVERLLVEREVFRAMKPCSSCHRHLLADAEACPFCGASCPMTRLAPRVGVILGVALCGCGPTVLDPGGAGADTSGSGEPMTSGTGESTSVTITSSSDTGESSSSPSTGFDAGSSDDDGAGSGGFYGGFGPYDNGGPIECSVWEQDCPDYEKCMPWSDNGTSAWNALKCTPVHPDPDQAGDPCIVEGSGVSGVDTCALGSMCFFVDEKTNEGTCVDQCEGSADTPICDDVDDACLIANDGVLSLCLPTCDPLLQSCGVGQVCVPGDGEFVCMSPYEQPAAAGEPCDGINACEAGLLCVEASMLAPGCDGSSCCTAYCDHTEGDTCAGALVCLPIFDASSPVGACLVED
jgi:hypothetical protein